MKKEEEKFRGFLREKKLKKTRTRELVFQEIFADPAVHPNAYEIHQRLRKKGHRLSLATVYRTLRLLVQAGLVSEIDLGENHSHYEPGGTKTGHGHLICLSCGEVREFFSSDLQSTISGIGEEKGFLLDKFSIQVFGTCRKCRK